MSDLTLPPAGDYQGGIQDSAHTEARADTAIRLRIAGMAYDEIARQLGYADKSGARGLVMRTLTHRVSESVVELRKLENERLDRAQAAIWPRVLRGEPRAIDTFLRLSQRRSRLNGLDAPVQVEVSGGLRVELEEALTELREALGLDLGDVIDAELVEDDPDPDA